MSPLRNFWAGRTKLTKGKTFYCSTLDGAQCRAFMRASELADDRSPRLGESASGGRNAAIALVAALMLLALALKIKLISVYGAVGAWDAAWWQEALKQGRISAGHESFFSALTDGRGAIPRGVEAALLSINGQWDPALQWLVNGVLFATTLGLAAWAVRLFWPTRFLAAIATLALIIVVFDFWQFDPPGPQASWYWLTFFSLGHILFSVRRNAGAVSRWLGHFAGLGAVLAGPTGFISAIVWCWLTYSGSRPQEKFRGDRTSLVWNSLLLLAGVGLAILRTSSPAPAMQSLDEGWKIQTVVLGAPLLIFLIRAIRSRKREAAIGLATAWVSLVFLQGLAVLTWPGLADLPLELRTLVILTSIACLWPMARGRWLSARVLLATAWSTFLLNQLWQQTSAARADEFWNQSLANETRASTIRGYLAQNDPRESTTAANPDTILAHAAIREPGVATILPLSIRAALPFKAAADSPETFQRGNFPDLKGRGEGLPAWSALPAESADTKLAEFRSAPVNANLPLLQFQVAGKLAPSENELWIETLSGRKIIPLQTFVTSTDRWKRLNIWSPGEPFRVVAQVKNSAAGFAFTAPVEGGMLSWLASKMVGLSPILLVGAAGLTLTALVSARAVWSSNFEAAKAVTLPPSLKSLLPWVGLLAYTVVAASHLDTYAGGADSAGYLNLARLLDHGALSTQVRAVPGLDFQSVSARAYLPNSFAAVGETSMTPTYPPGLPLMFSMANRVGLGANAIAGVILLHFVAGIWLTSKLAGAFGLSAGWAWGAATTVGLSPIFLFMGLQPMSDVPSLVWVTAAILCAWKSQRRPWLALPSGAAVALAILIRPANVIVALPILSCFVAAPRSGRRISFWIIGGVPGAILQAWYAQTFYGGVFRTGYGNVSELFNAKWILPTLSHYAIWLPVILSPLVVFALAYPFLRSVDIRARVMLGSLVGIYFSFYSIYFFTHETWWYLRFLLPALPPLAVMAMVALRVGRDHLNAARLGRINPRIIRATPGLILVGVIVWLLVADDHLMVFNSARQNSVYLESARWLERNVPANAVVFSNYGGGALFYYTDLVVMNFTLSAAEKEKFSEFAARETLPVYAMVFDDERNLIRQIPGTWREAGSFRNMLLWQWSP